MISEFEKYWNLFFPAGMYYVETFENLKKFGKQSLEGMVGHIEKLIDERKREDVNREGMELISVVSELYKTANDAPPLPALRKYDHFKDAKRIWKFIELDWDGVEPGKFYKLDIEEITNDERFGDYRDVSIKVCKEPNELDYAGLHFHRTSDTVLSDKDYQYVITHPEFAKLWARAQVPKTWGRSDLLIDFYYGVAKKSESRQAGEYKNKK